MVAYPKARVRPVVGDNEQTPVLARESRIEICSVEFIIDETAELVATEKCGHVARLSEEEHLVGQRFHRLPLDPVGKRVAQGGCVRGFAKRRGPLGDCGVSHGILLDCGRLFVRTDVFITTSNTKFVLDGLVVGDAHRNACPCLSRSDIQTRSNDGAGLLPKIRCLSFSQ